MMNDAFTRAIEGLKVPEMGTECVGPLLYWLVRLVRPEKVLEIGMGYTTPFLAQALHDNVTAIRSERETLNDPSANEPLAYRQYYSESYQPQLICIDRMTDATSSAVKVADALERLALTDLCHVIEGDLATARDDVRAMMPVIDLAWVDTWDTLAFIGNYWEMIDPSGGIIAIHWLMTYPEGRAVLRYLESLRSVEDGRLELTSFREPHKVAQNSITLVRRVRTYQDPEDLRPFGSTNDPEQTLARWGR